MSSATVCFRVCILLTSSLVSFSSNCVHQMYAVLQPEFTKAPNCTVVTPNADCCADCLGIGDATYNLMFTIKSCAGVLSLPIAGLMLDKFGNSLSVPICLLQVIGAALVAIGGCVRGSATMLPLVAMGFLFIGASSSPSSIARDRFIGIWFENSNLRLAFGISSSINNAAALPSFLLTERLRELAGLQVTLWCCVLVCAASAACAVAATSLEASANRRLGLTDQLRHKRRSVSVCDLRHVSGEFWLLVGVFGFFAAAYNTYADNSVEFVNEKFYFTKQDAAMTSGFLHIVCIVASPVIGVVLDKLGRAAFFLMFATLLPLPALLLLTFTGLHPLVGTAMYGLAYSFVNTTVLTAIIVTVGNSLIGISTALAFTLAALTGASVQVIVGAILGNELGLPLPVKLIRWRLTLIFMTSIAAAGFAQAITVSLLSWWRESHITAACHPAAASQYQQINGDGGDGGEKSEKKVAAYGAEAER